MYTIKAVQNLTGLKPETLRNWERRYGLGPAERHSNGRRLFSEKDVRRLKLISKLLKSGHSIGQLAKFSVQQLQDLSQDVPEIEAQTDTNRLLRELNSAVRSGEFERFRHLLVSSLSLYPPVVAIEEILAPILRTIGSYWHQSIIDVSREHAFSTIVKEELHTALRSYKWSATGPKITLTTPSGEAHEIGSLMASYIAASQGFGIHYLGPNMPAKDLLVGVKEAGSKILALSIINNVGLTNYEQELQTIASGLPPGVELWLGVSEEMKRSGLTFPSTAIIFENFESFQDKLVLLAQS